MGPLIVFCFAVARAFHYPCLFYYMAEPKKLGAMGRYEWGSWPYYERNKRTLLGAKGIATRSKGLTTRNKKLLILILIASCYY